MLYHFNSLLVLVLMYPTNTETVIGEKTNFLESKIQGKLFKRKRKIHEQNQLFLTLIALYDKI